jgi:flagellar motor switch protein FliG
MNAPTEANQLTPRQKVAAFLVALGPEHAAPILAYLDEAEVEAVAHEISRLGRLSTSVLDDVVDEFFNDVATAGGGLVGGLDYARSLLENWQGTRSEEIIQQLMDAAQNRPFGFLAQLEPEQLMQFISEEHPQTIALIITYLPNTFGARLLSLLSEDVQGEVALRIARIGPATPDVVKQVEAALKERLGSVTSTELQEQSQGAPSLAELLNTADRSTERVILDHLSSADPVLAEQVRALMFVFEDIVEMQDKDLQEVLRSIDSKQLAMALKGVKDEVAAKVTTNLSERAAGSLNDEVEYLGAVKVTDVEAAQSGVVAIIRQLEEEGRVTVRAGAEGGFIE